MNSSGMDLARSTENEWRRLGFCIGEESGCPIDAPSLEKVACQDLLLQ